MKPEPREPSRLPVRGTIAAAGSAGALALLLSFQGGTLAPSEPAQAAAGDRDATDELITGAPTETSGAEAVVGHLAVVAQTQCLVIRQDGATLLGDSVIALLDLQEDG